MLSDQGCDGGSSGNQEFGEAKRSSLTLPGGSKQTPRGRCPIHLSISSFSKDVIYNAGVYRYEL